MERSYMKPVENWCSSTNIRWNRDFKAQTIPRDKGRFTLRQKFQGRKNTGKIEQL